MTLDTHAMALILLTAGCRLGMSPAPEPALAAVPDDLVMFFEQVAQADAFSISGTLIRGRSGGQMEDYLLRAQRDGAAVLDIGGDRYRWDGTSATWADGHKLRPSALPLDLLAEALVTELFAGFASTDFAEGACLGVDANAAQVHYQMELPGSADDPWSICMVASKSIGPIYITGVDDQGVHLFTARFNGRDNPLHTDLPLGDMDTPIRKIRNWDMRETLPAYESALPWRQAQFMRWVTDESASLNMTPSPHDDFMTFNRLECGDSPAPLELPVRQVVVPNLTDPERAARVQTARSTCDEVILQVAAQVSTVVRGDGRSCFDGGVARLQKRSPDGSVLVLHEQPMQGCTNAQSPKAHQFRSWEYQVPLQPGWDLDTLEWVMEGTVELRCDGPEGRADLLATGQTKPFTHLHWPDCYVP
ncbi:MAG: hypothetical protein ACI8PZ_006147 [Myxococcota bacterium]|jgi:hypothetical protein